MYSSIEPQIIECEQRLQAAMLNSDVSALDELLAEDLLFTNHLGQVYSKQDDLGAHRSGLLEIESLSPSERHIRTLPGVAIVTLRMQIVGSYDGVASAGDFRFTRVWRLSSTGRWQIAVAHSCLVV